ncbi:MAG TPA: GPP34 family phosphoprotein [Streptosporangiaceae bacterium]|nr:GPP34 family phosphoprotein [Streptosporangiaceae bacterium]
MTATLSGTGQVADDLYLMAHHELSGKPYVQPRALGLGLAGGLLAELMLVGRVTLVWERLVLAEGAAPGDGLACNVLGLVAGEREHRPVREWLLFLARTAADDVACRLARSGYLTWAGGRARWRGGRWVPVDADCAFTPLIRVCSALNPARPPSAHSLVLAGLAAACGLGFRLADYAPGNAGRSVDEAVALLVPGLRELVAQTQAAVDSALLSHRVCDRLPT